MSYQLVGAVVRRDALDANWIEKDVSDDTLADLLSNYSKVYLTLSNPVLEDNVYLDLEAALAWIPPSTDSPSVTDWLASLGNTTLPTSDTAPETTLHPVKYADAWYAGYKAVPADYTRSPGTQAPAGALDDLLLSKPGIDFTTYGKYCLATVNGFVHRVGGAAEGLYVVKGNESSRIANDNHVGLLSFLDVGELTLVPITPEMVYKTNPNEAYKNFVHVKSPISLENKTVLLVLGGYLHAADKTYRRINDRSIRIDFNNYPFPERIFESLKKINLSSLGLDPPPTNKEQFALDDLYSDRAIEAYVSLPQSFLVVVDTPTFYVRYQHLEKLKIPGRFVGPSVDRFPLVSGLGRFYDYFIEPEDGQYVYVTAPTHDTQYNFRTHGWEDTLSVDSTRYSAKPWRLSRGTLLEMGSYL